MGTNPINGGLVRVLMMLFFLTQFTISFSTSNLTDLSALLALKSQFVLKSNDPIAQNWTTNSTTFCNWIGISCSIQHQRVTALNLSYMNLQGTISPHIGNLSFLAALNFRNNSFHGAIPESIGRLRRLRAINLRYNQLRGEIPSSLTQCKRLQSIILGSNFFGGSLPEEIGELPSLEKLLLENNLLTGIVPSNIFNISSLKALDLGENNLSGEMPVDLCHGLPWIEFLSLRMVQLGGRMPDSLCGCKNLVDIQLVQNNLAGSIPRDLGCLSILQYITLPRNRLTGTVPPSIGNLSNLIAIELIDNYLSGEIPEELTQLPQVRFLRIAFNNLSGHLPRLLFNISSAGFISFMRNNLNGNIPEFTVPQPRLHSLNLLGNRLSGRIPDSISNASSLTFLELSNNSLQGPVPMTLGNLQVLETLNLQRNQLSNDPQQRELNFLTSLTQCRRLKNLVIGLNPFNGELPMSVGNLSGSLELFSADASMIRGSLPSSIGNIRSLMSLELAGNNLRGTIPASIGNLTQLQNLRLFHNNIEGTIPTELCRSTFLSELLLHQNNLSGAIPQCIGVLSRMQALSLSYNALDSIPMSLWSLKDIWFLDVSQNVLRGFLPPDIGNMELVQFFDLSINRLTGSIPVSISKLKMVTELNLSRNSFSGRIPEAIGELGSLESLNLSSNVLVGEIPKSLEKLPYLRYLNLSYNMLSGEVPNGGVFKNLTFRSISGNDALCSNISALNLPSCKTNANPKWRNLTFWLKYVFPPVSVVIILSILAVLYIKKQVKSKEKQNPVELFVGPIPNFISHHELVQATDNFSQENLIGAGSFGSVYKGTLSNGELVAVKVFDLDVEGAMTSFDTECEVLRNVRHRNLLKIISSCSNLDFRALVSQYMPNGNLENLLHYQELNLLQRLDIVIDVAMGMEYLHHGYSEPVVHCDLKPSNVLLDEEMTAHVGDFGLAKVLAKYKSMTLTEKVGTMGYIAPEFGLDGRVSTKGDVYSYGILLMETFTRKRPIDPMFGGGLSLREWVNWSFPLQIMKVVDESIVIDEKVKDHQRVQACLSSIMEVALECSKDLPGERMDMKDVVAKLNKIKRHKIKL